MAAQHTSIVPSAWLGHGGPRGRGRPKIWGSALHLSLHCAFCLLGQGALNPKLASLQTQCLTLPKLVIASERRAWPLGCPVGARIRTGLAP